MSKAVSRGQALQIASRVGTQIDWDSLDGDQLQQVINLSPKEFGKRFTMFLKYGAHVFLGEPKKLVITPILPDENDYRYDCFAEGNRTIWKGSPTGYGLQGEEDVDLRAAEMTEIDLSQLVFENCLRGKEKKISGEELLLRLKLKPNFVRLGHNVFHSLRADYKAHQENSIFEWIYRNYRVKKMFFFGEVYRFVYKPNDTSVYRDVFCATRWKEDDWSFLSPRYIGSDFKADELAIGCYVNQ